MCVGEGLAGEIKETDGVLQEVRDLLTKLSATYPDTARWKGGLAAMFAPLAIPSRVGRAKQQSSEGVKRASETQDSILAALDAAMNSLRECGRLVEGLNGAANQKASEGAKESGNTKYANVPPEGIWVRAPEAAANSPDVVERGGSLWYFVGATVPPDVCSECPKKEEPTAGIRPEPAESEKYPGALAHYECTRKLCLTYELDRGQLVPGVEPDYTGKTVQVEDRFAVYPMSRQGELLSNWGPGRGDIAITGELLSSRVDAWGEQSYTIKNSEGTYHVGPRPFSKPVKIR